MRKAMKVQGKLVFAWPLGTGDPMEAAMVKLGAIRETEDGGYKLMSQEAVNGVGQKAGPGDWFKVDIKGGKCYPYPNTKEFFEGNHRHIGGCVFEQMPKPVQIWQVGEEMPGEVKWLVEQGKLELKPETPDRFFNAELWDTKLSAPCTATLIFYSVDRDDTGTITGADFNFVAEEEFKRDYRII